MKYKNKSDEPDMNLTPVIDIVFNLIIFFMLVTQIVVDEIPLRMPGARTSEKPEASRIQKYVINVDREGNVYLGAQMLGKGRADGEGMFGTLLSELKAIKLKHTREGEEFPDVQIKIRADRGTDWAYVQEVITRLSSAGIPTVQTGAMRE